MVHDRHGDVVETNVTDWGEDNMVFLAMVHPEAMARIEELFDSVGTFEKMPDFDVEQKTPIYYLSPRSM